ncbi:MAG: ribulose-phosphate 3-epimerase [Planctomycetaceae bacterium]
MTRRATFSQLRKRSPLIAPSMLKCDFGNLQRDVALLEAAGADVIHLDVMDGHFVPNLSYGPMVIQRLRELTALPFDAHLMISEPGRYLDDYLEAGCDWVTFHVEAVPEPVPLLRRIRERGAVGGLALNPGTPVSAIEAAVPECDLLVVMSVEPGFGGQSFIPEVLEKVRWIAENRRIETCISIDGGIGPATIAGAAEAGAELFVAGSAVFDATDYSDAVSELRRIAAQSRNSTSVGA